MLDKNELEEKALEQVTGGAGGSECYGAVCFECRAVMKDGFPTYEEALVWLGKNMPERSCTKCSGPVRVKPYSVNR